VKCSKCKENDATYYISHESTRGAGIGFCDTCAEEIGIFSALRRVESLLHGYGLKSDDAPVLGRVSLPIEFAESCKACGTDLLEFERNFYFGCEECAVVFGSLIANYLSLLGARGGGAVSIYPGRPPRSYREKNDLQALNNRIKKCLDGENYQEAAELRRRYDELDEKIRAKRRRFAALPGGVEDSVAEAGDNARGVLLENVSPLAPLPATWLLTCIEVRRNFSAFNFPPRLEAPELNFVRRYAENLLPAKQARALKRVSIGKLDWGERKAFETKLLGRRLYPGAALLADSSFSNLILLNNMDHLTFVFFSRERETGAALLPVSGALGAVERKAEIAFSSRFGYITTAPKHLGAGLSASVLLHLPYSLFRGRVYSYPSKALERCVKFEPLAGNNFEQHGFFRVTSAPGFGKCEAELVSEVLDFACELAAEEEKIRAGFTAQEESRLRNIMKKVMYHAAQSYRLAYPDVLRFTTFMSLGVERGAVELPGFNLDEVFPLMTSAFIMLRDGARYSVNECEKRRADLFAALVEKWSRGK